MPFPSLVYLLAYFEKCMVDNVVKVEIKWNEKCGREREREREEVYILITSTVVFPLENLPEGPPGKSIP